MRKKKKASLIVATLVFLFLLIPTGISVDTSGSTSFHFGAAGDHSQDINTNSSLHRLASSDANFYLTLADMSYTSISDETNWWGVVKSYVGQTFPFELVSRSDADG